ncbi:hypothetical protein BASA61_009856 [Batrachochytrium salamandrivorans]|nr:hypothetical protein BASA60_010751 [Batrachochytrium salamandrivorans]KAH6580044.1 hypothetical protein BASA61_009856 [Batrachochytrium salamandrivorans]
MLSSSIGKPALPSMVPSPADAIESNLTAMPSTPSASAPIPKVHSDKRKTKTPIQLNEADLVEKFTKGSGPGGQKINKCKHSVQLWHTPSGLFVETQRFRELASNRKEARKLLLLKLDQQINGSLSKVAVKLEKYHKKISKQKQRAKKKYGSVNNEALQTAVTNDPQAQQGSDVQIGSDGQDNGVGEVDLRVKK